MDNIIRALNFRIEPELHKEIVKEARVLELATNDVILRQGQYVKILPIVIEGAIRIFQQNEEREILLYYVKSSQTCVMSLSASFFNHSSAIKAVVIEPTKILAVPSRLIGSWQRQYPSWNNFVMQTFKDRYDELLSSFKSVAFDHIDKRVWNYLTQRASITLNNEIKISHNTLALEMGTTRVVISRILKQFEREEKLFLKRGLIEIRT